jgi:two-component system response regulator AtoC
MDPLKILIVDDEPHILNTMQLGLEAKGYRVATAISGEEGLEKYKSDRPDVILLDIRLAGMDGMAVLKSIKEQDARTQVVMMTAFGSIRSAVEAMKLGAYDYIAKPSSLDEVTMILRNAEERFKLFDENSELKAQLRSRYRFENIVGTSAAMQKVYQLMERVIETDSTVLISGETGTGKEMIAQAIHYNSKRAGQLFQAIHCAGLQENLLENELFGHEKGAFTGADARKYGLFEIADKGSVFLDEISEMSSVMQAKLLRVLQEKEFLHVGGIKPVRVDVRVLAATNDNLEKLVKDGKFRQDLYYRINVVPLRLPPLRERKEDIPLLASHFLTYYTKKHGKKLDKISQEALAIFEQYDWPGNVRELENAVEHGVNLAMGQVLGLNDLPGHLRGSFEGQAELKLIDASKLYKDACHEFERLFIINALRETGGNVTYAADKVGLPRGSFQKIMRRHIVKSENYRAG